MKRRGFIKNVALGAGVAACPAAIAIEATKTNQKVSDAFYECLLDSRRKAVDPPILDPRYAMQQSAAETWSKLAKVREAG